MTERTKDRIGLTAAAIVATVFLLLNFGVVWSAPVQVPIRFHYGAVQDTVTVEVYAFGTIIGSFVKANTANVDTVLSFGDDTIWQVTALSRTAPDSLASWTIQVNRRSSNGPVTWPIRMYWTEPTDSARVRFFKDSVVAQSFNITGKQSFDSGYDVSRDTLYSVVADLYYAGVSNPTSWLWNLVWRRIDTGQLVDPPTASMARLYGYAKLPDGTPARGALITITRGGAYNSTAGSTTKYAVTADAISFRTDSLGKFQKDVIASNSFSDTTNAYYNVACKWKSVELFNVRHIWAQGGSTINVLDSLNR